MLGGTRAFKQSRARLALLTAVLVGSGLPCLAQDAPPDTRKTKYWLYCPRCGLEMACPPQWVNKGCICPRCAQRDARMLVTTSPPSQTVSVTSVTGIILRVLAFAGAGALVVAWFVLRRRRAARAQAALSSDQLTLCSACGRLLRYHASEEGMTATCPGCGGTVSYIAPRVATPRKATADLESWRSAMKRARWDRKYGNRGKR